MIFVTVGIQKFQFNRLIEEIDNLVGKKLISEEIFAQTGHSDYIPKHFESKDFLSEEEFKSHIRESDLVIAHSGVATIMSGLKANKPIIVVPRLMKFGEHVDDHQLQIAEPFHKQNLILMCGEDESLIDCIAKVKKYNFSKYIAQEGQAVKVIKEYLHLE